MALLFVVDQLNLVYRNYFALLSKGLATSKGVPSGTVFGFVNSILLLHDQFISTQGAQALIAGDGDGNWRREIYPHYKEVHHELPDEFYVELSAIDEFIQLFGLHSIRVTMFEADDVMATLVRMMTELNTGVALVTNDKDLAQCVSDAKHVALLRATGAGYEWMQEKEVLAKFGVEAHQIPDYLALVGDPGDGIPGIKGIGEKTAASMLKEYGSLENLLDNTSLLSDRHRVKLEQLKEHARVYKQLATCRTDVPLDQCVTPPTVAIDHNGLEDFARKWELQSLTTWVTKQRGGE